MKNPNEEGSLNVFDRFPDKNNYFSTNEIARVMCMRIFFDNTRLKSKIWVVTRVQPSTHIDPTDCFVINRS